MFASFGAESKPGMEAIPKVAEVKTVGDGKGTKAFAVPGLAPKPGAERHLLTYAIIDDAGRHTPLGHHNCATYVDLWWLPHHSPLTHIWQKNTAEPAPMPNHLPTCISKARRIKP